MEYKELENQKYSMSMKN